MYLLSVCVPVYNNVKYVHNFLDKLIIALNGLDYEIVVVDGYSTDGTFELLTNYAKKYRNIRIYRYRCKSLGLNRPSRGLARQLAFKLSKGKYIIPLEFDVFVEPEKFRLAVESYLKSPLRDKKGTNIIIPRDLINEAGGWRDLHRAEDVDFLTRLFMKDLLVWLPVKIGVHVGVPTSQRSFLPSERYREKKYVKNLMEAIPYYLRNKIDMICGSGYTMKKVLTTYRYIYRKSLVFCFLTCIYHLFFILLNRLTGLNPIFADKNLSNYGYVSYKSIVEAVNPLELGFTPHDIVDPPNIDSPEVIYIANFHPEIIKMINKVRSWKQFS
jgi:glycosyltransferase involved in cell wall biosynthesis